jgi:hypothetical protein
MLLKIKGRRYLLVHMSICYYVITRTVAVCLHGMETKLLFNM